MNAVNNVNRKVKKTLKVAPKTEDDDYTARKKSFKALADSLKDYKSAMEKAKKSIKGVMDALTHVRKAFDQITTNPELSDHSSDLVLSFSTTLDRLKADIYDNFEKTMDTQVIAPMNDIKNMESECTKAEHERTKYRKEFDLYRDLVKKKEAEYLKKNKELSVSKSYSGDVTKMNDNQKLFEEADQKYIEAHGSFLSHGAFFTSQSIESFMRCWRDLMSSFTSEFSGLASATGGSATVDDYE
ncbi:hypothetical protein, conserved [Angomonas deanei]|uniref:BAR domain containing protein n=1 Tax=Angomonas deanei TaxID=59799 RepID=A0A7G2CRV2_9TRYP|nr:hypothetical protein, conserved [Angomonas deanei]